MCVGSDLPRNTSEPCVTQCRRSVSPARSIAAPGTQHPSVELLGAIRESRGLVDRVTDNGVLITVLRADVAGEDRAGRHADTKINWEAA
jgi:hypothetical protein